jgi:zinc transporter ZupT
MSLLSRAVTKRSFSLLCTRRQVCGLLGAIAVSAMTTILPYALAFAAGAMVYVLPLLL